MEPETLILWGSIPSIGNEEMIWVVAQAPMWEKDMDFCEKYVCPKKYMLIGKMIINQWI